MIPGGVTTGDGQGGFSDVDSLTPVASHVVGYRSWFLAEDTGLDPEPITVGARSKTVVTWSDAARGRPRGALCGITHRGYMWGDGINVAECGRVAPVWSTVNDDYEARQKWNHHRATHKAASPPIQDCGCGFWAYTATERTVTNVWGVIHGWGRIVAGPKGFRCQYARIVALYVDAPGANASTPTPMSLNHRERRREAVAACYPSVTMFDDLDAMIATHPATDLSAMLGLDDEHDDG